MAVADKKRYEAEMLDYTPPPQQTVDSTTSGKEVAKGPNAPKKSKSAYSLFLADTYSKIDKSNSTLDFSKISKQLGAESPMKRKRSFLRLFHMISTVI